MSELKTCSVNGQTVGVLQGAVVQTDALCELEAVAKFNPALHLVK